MFAAGFTFESAESLCGVSKDGIGVDNYLTERGILVAWVLGSGADVRPKDERPGRPRI